MIKRRTGVYPSPDETGVDRSLQATVQRMIDARTMLKDWGYKTSHGQYEDFGYGFFPQKTNYEYEFEDGTIISALDFLTSMDIKPALEKLASENCELTKAKKRIRYTVKKEKSSDSSKENRRDYSTMSKSRLFYTTMRSITLKPNQYSTLWCDISRCKFTVVKQKYKVPGQRFKQKGYALEYTLLIQEKGLSGSLSNLFEDLYGALEDKIAGRVKPTPKKQKKKSKGKSTKKSTPKSEITIPEEPPKLPDPWQEPAPEEKEEVDPWDSKKQEVTQ